MFQILVAEDDRPLRELLCAVLTENGFHPLEAGDGKEALAVMESQYVDLVISDIMMPNMDGYELTRQLRLSDSNLPILMITAKNDSFYKREGFQSGTDDYMVKPIDVNELIWRVRALLRRSQSIHDRKLVVGGTTFYSDSYEVVTAEGRQVLPPKEFNLLYKLVSTPNRTFTRMQLLDDIWGMDSEVSSHTLEVHVGRIRERFRENPDFEIITVRGLGYKAVIR